MPFVKRLNTHQTHFEDLVLLGPDGLEELNDKIEGTIDTLENESGRLNLTTKIDGAPAMICWSSYPGYPDNSIALKGFISGPQNAISSPDQVDAKYGDRPGMSQMLKYGLELAKHIPAGEAWQGDCLFVGDTKREEEINGKDYITFQPNKIIYAFSEDNPGYEKVKNADFGIAFHTIYTGEDKKQSFKVDASKLNVPSNIYIMSPSLNKPTDKKVFNLDKVKSQFDRLENLEQKLLSNFDYEDLVNNRVFMNYWNTFENANLADKKAVTINENTFINDLKEYIKSKRTKEYETQVGKLKTDAGKEKAKTKYEQDLVDLQELVETNKELLTILVQTLNCAATIKMLLWQGFKQTQFDYNTFYRSRTKGYIPGEMEGVAMSDQDGNIVKIVDRSTFSSYNRDPDIMSGFEHPENLTEEQQCFVEEYNNELTECGPKQLWERFGKLLESDQKTAVVAFGRMNPPTIGHQKLVDKMASLAQGEKAKLFLSHTQDKKKNPLSYEQKIRYAKEAFEPKIDVVESDDKTIIDVLYNLYNQGYTDIIYVGGEDRIGGAEDISSLILRYNGQPTKDGRIVYDFNSIKFESAGARNDDSDDLVEKASASLARQYAKEGDFEHFKEIAATDAENMYHDVRAGLGILDESKLVENAGENFEFEVANDLANNIKIKGISFNNFIHEEVGGGNLNTESDIRVEFNGNLIGFIEVKDTEQQAKFLEFNYSQDDSGNIIISGRDLDNNDKELCAELVQLQINGEVATEKYQSIARKLVQNHYSKDLKNVDIFAIKQGNKPAYIDKDSISQLIFIPETRVRGDYVNYLSPEEVREILPKAINGNLIKNISDPDFAKVRGKVKTYRTTLVEISPENIELFKGSGGSFGKDSYYLKTVDNEKYRLYPVTAKPNYYGVLGFRLRGGDSGRQLYSLKASSNSLKSVDKLSYSELTNYFLAKIK